MPVALQRQASGAICRAIVAERMSPLIRRHYWPEISEEAFMSRQSVKVLFLLAGVVLFVSAIALAKKPKTITIYSDSVLPSGQELKAGDYQIDVNETSKLVTFTRDDKVVATAGYKVVEKAAKNPYSQARFGQKDNKQELQEIRFSGESRSILIVGGES
jgi:hypothetical protein